MVDTRRRPFAEDGGSYFLAKTTVAALHTLMPAGIGDTGGM
jgi:hypothetical protein